MEIVKIYRGSQTVNYQQYDNKDETLIVSSYINSEIDPNVDIIEVTAYGENNEYLDYLATVNTYKQVQGAINPVSGLVNKIQLDPKLDAGILGLDRGRINLQYNFLKPLFNSTNINYYWIKQISPSRKEIKLSSQYISNEAIRGGFADFQAYVAQKNYFVDFYLNFGQNRLAIANNAALVNENNQTYLLVKLYEPLPIELNVKDTVWLCDKIADSVIYTIDTEIEADQTIDENALRGPNRKIKINDRQGQTTPYYNYSSLFSSNLSSSMQQLSSYYDDKAIEINVDYTNFSNFIHFSSATERINNFVYKLELIEGYQQEILDSQTLASMGSQTLTAVSQSNVLIQQKIDNIIKKFDVYEYYLYYSSESFAWPKSTSIKPYALYSITSSQALAWLGDEYTYPSLGAVSMLYSASLYDDTNKDKLSNAIPQYLLEDSNNEPYVAFIDMIGQHFDNLWLYYKDLSNRYSSFNNPKLGISKDLVADALRGFGFNLYTNTSVSDNLYYTLFGMNPDGSLLPPTGSEIITNYVTSSIDTLSPRELDSEVYKRLYHNLSYLLKTKGSQRAVKALIASYGIPDNILTVNEFGGNNIYTGSGIFEINNQKINYFTQSAELSDPVLSPYVTLQRYNTDYRNNVLDVEVGFSPSDEINRNFVSSSGFVSIDQLIGDPLHQYLQYYPDLKTARDDYFASYNYPHSIWEYIRIIKYYNNSLFKTIKDFVPARANASTGIIVKSHILERNKYARTEPSMSFDNNISESIDMISIVGGDPGAIQGNTQYTENIITPLGYASLDYTEDKAKITGRLSGSLIQATTGEVFDQSDYSTTPSGSIEIDYAANYQNILTANRSQRFLELDYAQNQNTPTNYGLVTQSISNSIDNNFNTYNDPYAPYADIQDYNYYTRAFTDFRYYGSRLSSLTYNTYTSASSNYSGDVSYGKTATIDRNSIKFAWVKNIPSESLNFYDKTSISIKYLVDGEANLLELNSRNENVFEVQNVFKSGTPVDVSISDIEKPSKQRTLDGTKYIFRGGFSFSPIFFREENESYSFNYTNDYVTITSSYGIRAVMIGSYEAAHNAGYAYTNAGQLPSTQWTQVLPKGFYDRQSSKDFYTVIPLGEFREGNVDPNGDSTYVLYSSGRVLQSGERFAETYIPMLQWKYNESLATANKVPNGINSPGTTIPIRYLVSEKYPNDQIIGFAMGNPQRSISNNTGVYKLNVPLFDVLNPSLGGFNNENPKTAWTKQQNTAEPNLGTKYYYKVPRSGTYVLRGAVPIRVTSMLRSNELDKAYNYFTWNPNQLINNNNTAPSVNPNVAQWGDGFAVFKVFGVVEKTLTPDIEASWEFVTATMIDSSFKNNVLISQYPPLPATKIFLTDQKCYSAYNLICFKNTIDINNYRGVFNFNMSIVNPDPLTSATDPYKANVVFKKDEYVRFQVYFMDMNNVLGGTKQFSLAINENWEGIVVRGAESFSNRPYFEIINKDAVYTEYDYSVPLLNVSRIFNTSGSTLTLSKYFSTAVLTSESIFIPTGDSKNYYTEVIDPFDIKNGDIIRFGKYKLANKDSYYTVLNTSSSINELSMSPTQTYPSTFITGRTLVGSAIYQYIYYNVTYPTPEQDWDATETTRLLQDVLEVGDTITVTGTLASNSTLGAINTPVTFSAITSPVTSGTTLQTPNNRIYVTNLFTKNQGTSTSFESAQIQLNNAKIVFNKKYKTTTITLDKPLRSTDNDLDFAILRPKDDETSVILDYKKLPGEVSQTLLIPYDLKEDVKKSVANIASSISQQLSDINL